MHARPLDDARIIDARSQLLARGDIPSGVVADTIERSWRRCMNYGLDATRMVQDARLSTGELRTLREKNGLLIAHAKPEMETLHEQISSTGSIVLLTDADGMILHALGDDDFLDTATRVSLQEGVSWGESWRGTNAIGTALQERVPVAVHAAEHFVEHHHRLSCSAVPILDANGSVVGALDVSNDYRVRQQHTLALVRMSAQMIENRLFNARHDDGIALYFHARQEFVGTLWQGIAIFAHDGKLKALNRSGRFQLGLEHAALDRLVFDELFDQSFGVLQSRLQGGMSPLLPLRMGNGARIYARLQAPHEQQRIVSRMQNRPSANALEALNHGDLRLARAIDQVKRVIDRDIPILIEGETGVGKELFAQAIHQSSRRCNKPFIAINCAALPEGLIESELFGYEEGAFTGARRRGSPGKLLQADGGTLFLDEIGDMPLSLQARLLRVLQERRVTPLGGEARPVDIAIVSATNRKLGELVAQGEFRSDLYYRLNGLAVTLPPLRERADLKALTRHLLEKEQADGVRFSDEVAALFESHPWPGNLRQLHTVLRTALALKDDGDQLSREHLPQSFIDELGMQPVDTEGSLDKLETESIRNTLLAHAGNVSSAARQLGISRTTLYRKLRQMGLS